jgi:hypothetical protein
MWLSSEKYRKLETLLSPKCSHCNDPLDFEGWHVDDKRLCTLCFTDYGISEYVRMGRPTTSFHPPKLVSDLFNKLSLEKENNNKKENNSEKENKMNQETQINNIILQAQEFLDVMKDLKEPMDYVRAGSKLNLITYDMYQLLKDRESNLLKGE